MQWEDLYPLNAARGGCFLTGASQRSTFEATGRPEKVLVTGAWLDGNVEGQVCISESIFVEAARSYGMLPPDETDALQHELRDTKHAYELAMAELESYRRAVVSVHEAMKAAGLE